MFRILQRRIKQRSYLNIFLNLINNYLAVIKKCTKLFPHLICSLSCFVHFEINIQNSINIENTRVPEVSKKCKKFLGYSCRSKSNPKKQIQKYQVIAYLVLFLLKHPNFLPLKSDYPQQLRISVKNDPSV